MSSPDTLVPASAFPHVRHRVSDELAPSSWQVDESGMFGVVLSHCVPHCFLLSKVSIA